MVLRQRQTQIRERFYLSDRAQRDGLLELLGGCCVAFAVQLDHSSGGMSHRLQHFLRGIDLFGSCI